MARFLLLVAAASFLAGCASANGKTDLYRSLHPDEEVVETEDRFLGYVRDALAEHVRYCNEGLSFTVRSFENGVRTDWERMVRTLD